MRDVKLDAGREHLGASAQVVVDCSANHWIPKLWRYDMIRILSSRMLGMHIEQFKHALWEQQYPATPLRFMTNLIGCRCVLEKSTISRTLC
jgi:hypothetical protein